MKTLTTNQAKSHRKNGFSKSTIIIKPSTKKKTKSAAIKKENNSSDNHKGFQDFMQYTTSQESLHSSSYLNEAVDTIDFEAIVPSESEDLTEEELQNLEKEYDDNHQDDNEEDYIITSKDAISDDSIKYYLEEISRYKLLNQEEEYDLSRRIQNGDEKALEQLINSNLRLVVKIAKNYVSSDYQLIDIIQDGNLGLIHAAKKFDHKKQVRFSTYASWWIKQTIIRSLSVRRRMIRIPHRKEEKLRKIKKAYNTFYQANKKAPTRENLAEILDIPCTEIDDILNAANPVVSYENTINDEDTCTIKNLLSDDSYKPEDILIKDILKKEAHKLLDTLYPKERLILSYRFGFKDGKKLTLKKMGKHFGISAETVRQIEIKALRKLRENFKYLEEYLN